MSRPENRSQMMDRLGAIQVNTVWSWCAVNEKDRKVYFSIWTDSVHKVNGINHYVIQSPEWGGTESGGRRSAARSDQDAKLSLVFEQGYEPYGYFIEAKNPKAEPREIANTLTSFVMRLKLSRREDGAVIATSLQRIEIA